MTFDSIIFLFAFLPVSTILYYITPAKYKNLMLVLISVLFYAWGGFFHTMILLFSVLWNYMGGRFLNRNHKRRKRARNIMAVTVGVDVLLLAVCRYTGQILEMSGSSLADIRYFFVPMGVSFFMLQNIAYIIDIYREDIRPQKDIVKYAAMIVMYPKIIAGPLVSGNEFEKQLSERKLSIGKISDGTLLFLRGLSKKVILGNGMGMIFETVQMLPAGKISVLGAWVGCFAFAFRIYFSFGGYCDMAAGLARVFGFELPENVNYPFLSTGIMDFWSRWMATLWKWFCSYVYLPLCGGNPGGTVGFLSLLATWLLIGFWHGMNLTFIFWGIYFAVLLYLEGFVFGQRFSGMPKPVRWFFTMMLLMVSWVFFFSTSVGGAFSYLRFMIIGGGGGFAGGGAISILIDYGGLWVLALFFSTPLAHGAYERLIRGGRQWQTVLSCIVYGALFLLCIAGIVSGAGDGFLYF